MCCTMAAMHRPLPHPVPSPSRKPAVRPSGSVCLKRRAARATVSTCSEDRRWLTTELGSIRTSDSSSGRRRMPAVTRGSVSGSGWSQVRILTMWERWRRAMRSYSSSRSSSALPFAGDLAGEAALPEAFSGEVATPGAMKGASSAAWRSVPSVQSGRPTGDLPSFARASKHSCAVLPPSAWRTLDLFTSISKLAARTKRYLLFWPQ
mmetsp:Transcript_36014/g.106939  ORF Transcript_36014/g.106939 Transcript_36014/m.106939 type:complete len:206 (-) Transcript_36014:407-1024(-)